LNDYEGAVLIITHDRSLMEMVADRLWLAADGTIKPYDGDMEAYARFVLDRARLAARAEADARPTGPAAANAKDARKAAADARARLAPLKRAVEAVEKRMDQLTKTLAATDAALADPALFTKDPARAVALGKTRAETADALEAAELAWMEAAELYETAKTEAGV
jgi:ATP-binding cassette subfamily F protein 3